MHGPYDDPYAFPELNGGKPDDYDEHWAKVRAEIKKDEEKAEQAEYNRLKKKFE